jgi:hypothetical protein
MEGLRLTDTNAADDSKGAVWGLDGNLFIPVVVSAVLSIALLLVMIGFFAFSWLVGFAVASIPFIATTSYIALLKQGKPPGYDIDLLDLLFHGRAFSFKANEQSRHRRPR